MLAEARHTPLSYSCSNPVDTFGLTDWNATTVAAAAEDPLNVTAIVFVVVIGAAVEPVSGLPLAIDATTLDTEEAKLDSSEYDVEYIDENPSESVSWRRSQCEVLRKSSAIEDDEGCSDTSWCGCGNARSTISG